MSTENPGRKPKDLATHEERRHAEVVVFIGALEDKKQPQTIVDLRNSLWPERKATDVTDYEFLYVLRTASRARMHLAPTRGIVSFTGKSPDNFSYQLNSKGVNLVLDQASRDGQVKSLRDVDWDNKKIAQTLGLSESQVKLSIARLIKTGVIERKRPDNKAMSSRNKTVQSLLSLGMDYAEVAEQLDISTYTVQKHVTRLLAAGEIEKRKPRRNKEKLKSTIEREKLIKSLKLQNISNKEIAERLGISINSVKSYIKRLIATGEWQPHSGVKGDNKSLSELRSRDEQVRKLRKQGLPNAEIASRLDISIAKVGSSVRRLMSARRLLRRK